MYQKIIIIGRLGQDPVMKNVGGENLCKFSVATTNKWKDKSGTLHEDTTWHNIDVWGKAAENCGNYLRKGSMALVEGEVVITKKDDKSYYSVKAFNVRFLTPKSESGSSAEQGGHGMVPQQQQGTQSPQYTEDDIPF